VLGELSDETAQRITELCERGDDDVEHARYDEAVTKYEEALRLVPDPVFAWKATAWILTALGETHYFRRDFERAKNALLDAMRCPNGVGNAFVHFRLGQVELELGNAGRAKDELFRAYQRGGREVFEGEDPKYFALIADRLDEEQ
jgi:tetratricopeptide (TPR) repeat protein